jgi:hypothetical protein
VERGRVVHLRRRLTEDEARDIGPVLDIRGTADAYERMAVARLYLPPGLVNRPAF